VCIKENKFHHKFVTFIRVFTSKRAHATGPIYFTFDLLELN